MSATELTVLSWNMYCFNKRLDDALDFLRTQSCDVMCLQEVPETFLTALRTLPYSMVESCDSVWQESSGEVKRDYHVILSKHLIVSDATYPVIEHLSRRYRAQLFRLFMRYLASWRSGTFHDRTTHSADIEVGGKIVRVFSIHLELATPAIRKNEFEQVVNNLHSTYPNVVCGDFNILEAWRMKPLNLLLGGSPHQALPWYDERGRVEKLFEAAGLKNIFRGRITHKISHSQLDHILVPKDTEVVSSHVLMNTHGSDHRPIVATIKISG